MEVAAAGVAEGKAVVASEMKAAHAEVMERLRPLQAALKDSEKAFVAAKKAVVAADKAVVSARKLGSKEGTEGGNEDGIATAEENVSAQAQSARGIPGCF